MAIDGLPHWLPPWCRDHLGGEPAETLFRLDAEAGGGHGRVLRQVKSRNR